MERDPADPARRTAIDDQADPNDPGRLGGPSVSGPVPVQGEGGGRVGVGVESRRRDEPCSSRHTFAKLRSCQSPPQRPPLDPHPNLPPARGGRDGNLTLKGEEPPPISLPTDSGSHRLHSLPLAAPRVDLDRFGAEPHGRRAAWIPAQTRPTAIPPPPSAAPACRCAGC